MTPEEERLSVEIVKLLMQVAWADLELAEDEVTHVMQVARDTGLGEFAVGVMEEQLRGGAKLPPPDLGFLREHESVALAAAEKVIRADAHVSADEEALLEEIRQLLAG